MGELVYVVTMSAVAVSAITGVLEAGRNFLQKPYVPQTLAKKVREVLDAKEG